MVAVTVSIFGARQARHRWEGALLSAAFVLGIAAMFVPLGVFAGMSGKMFGSVLQNRWVIVAMATLFLALAASLFGAYEFGLPASLTNKLAEIGGIGYKGAFLLGLACGLIAAPCTGPVLTGILAWIASTKSAALGAAGDGRVRSRPRHAVLRGGGVRGPAAEERTLDGARQIDLRARARGRGVLLPEHRFPRALGVREAVRAVLRSRSLRSSSWSPARRRAPRVLGAGRAASSSARVSVLRSSSFAGFGAVAGFVKPSGSLSWEKTPVEIAQSASQNARGGRCSSTSRRRGAAPARELDKHTFAAAKT